MTILTGVRDAEYLSQFLGKKIAIQDERDKNKYYLYPKLDAIFADGIVWVLDSDHVIEVFPWDRCFSPYVVLNECVEWEQR